MESLQELTRTIRSEGAATLQSISDSVLSGISESPASDLPVDQINTLLAQGEFEQSRLLVGQAHRRLLIDISAHVDFKHELNRARFLGERIADREQLVFALTQPNESGVRQAIRGSSLTAAEKKEIIDGFKNKKSYSRASQSIFGLCENYQERLNGKMSELLSQLSYILLADAICKFRETYSRKRKKISDVQKIGQIIEDGYSRLNNAYTSLRSVVASDSPDQYDTFASILREDRRLRHSRYLTYLVQLDRYLLSRNATPTQKHREQTVELTNLIKEMIFLRQAVNYLQWHNDQPNKSRRYKSLVNQRAMRASVTVPRIPDNCITAFTPARVRSLRNGRNYSIAGLVSAINITERSRKAVSLVEIADNQGRIFPAVLEYIKVDSGGLAEDNYVIVSGKLENFNGQKTLRIDRLSYAEEIQRNWYWRLRYLLDPVFTPYSHNLNFSYNWLPVDGGAEKQLVFGTYR